jgi:hypothetical protein
MKIPIKREGEGGVEEGIHCVLNGRKQLHQ